MKFTPPFSAELTKLLAEKARKPELLKAGFEIDDALVAKHSHPKNHAQHTPAMRDALNIYAALFDPHAPHNLHEKRAIECVDSAHEQLVRCLNHITHEARVTREDASADAKQTREAITEAITRTGDAGGARLEELGRAAEAGAEAMREQVKASAGALADAIGLRIYTESKAQTADRKQDAESLRAAIGSAASGIEASLAKHAAGHEAAAMRNTGALAAAIDGRIYIASRERAAEAAKLYDLVAGVTGKAEAFRQSYAAQHDAEESARGKFRLIQTALLALILLALCATKAHCQSQNSLVIKGKNGSTQLFVRTSGLLVLQCDGSLACTWNAASNTLDMNASGGSSGGGVSSGALASIPTCNSGATGTQYIPTDSVFTLWCNGSAWKYLYQGMAVTPPDNSTYSWKVQQTGTAATVSGGIGTVGTIRLQTGTATGWNVYVISNPYSSGAVTATALVGAYPPYQISGAPRADWGFIAHDNTNAKWMGMNLHYNDAQGEPGMQLIGFTDAGSQWMFSGNNNTSWQGSESRWWIRLHYDGTSTLTAYWSPDGQVWQQYDTASTGSLGALDQFGFTIQTNTTSAAYSIDVLSLSIANI